MVLHPLIGTMPDGEKEVSPCLGVVPGGSDLELGRGIPLVATTKDALNLPAAQSYPQARTLGTRNTCSDTFDDYQPHAEAPTPGGFLPTGPSVGGLLGPRRLQARAGQDGKARLHARLLAVTVAASSMPDQRPQSTLRSAATKRAMPCPGKELKGGWDVGRGCSWLIVLTFLERRVKGGNLGATPHPHHLAGTCREESRSRARAVEGRLQGLVGSGTGGVQGRC